MLRIGVIGARGNMEVLVIGLPALNESDHF